MGTDKTLTRLCTTSGGCCPGVRMDGTCVVIEDDPRVDMTSGDSYTPEVRLTAEQARLLAQWLSAHLP